jgi:hypothetical protein
MNFDELFDILDLDSDSELSRSELNRAARNLRWHWREAPLYAVLDRLTIDKSMSREFFVSTLTQMALDPYGPFGKVLEKIENRFPEPVVGGKNASRTGTFPDERTDIVTLLDTALGRDPLERFEQFLNESVYLSSPVSAAESVLLVIDPQRSFTKGVWMNSFGPGAESEVRSIDSVFQNCSCLLRALDNRVEAARFHPTVTIGTSGSATS